MERDMDLIRRIAMEAAALPYGKYLSEIDGVPPEKFGVHAMWMEEAHLIKASITEYMDNTPPHAAVLRLTWEGCEFVDAVRDDTLWRKAKDTVLKPASSFTFGLLKDWLKAELQQGFPTLRGIGQ